MTGTEPPRNLIEVLADGPHGSAAEEYHHKHRMFIDALAEQIRSGGLTLLVVQPSYGCDFLAVCERLEAFEVR